MVNVNLSIRLGKLLQVEFKNKPLWAARGLTKVYESQTQVERAYAMTWEDNGVGFSSSDSEFGSQLAEQAIKWFDQKPSERKFLFPFSPKQHVCVVRLACKYRVQIANQMLHRAPEAAMGLFQKAGDKAAVKALQERMTPAPLKVLC